MYGSHSANIRMDVLRVLAEQMDRWTAEELLRSVLMVAKAIETGKADPVSPIVGPAPDLPANLSDLPTLSEAVEESRLAAAERREDEARRTTPERSGPPNWLPLLIRNARELREADPRTIPHAMLLLSASDPDGEEDPAPAQPNGSRVYYVNRMPRNPELGPRLEMFGTALDWRFKDAGDDETVDEHVGFPLRVVGLEYTPMLPGLNWPDENGQWRV